MAVARAARSDEPGRRTVAPRAGRKVAKTREFEHWFRGLDAERRTKVVGAIARIDAGGPTLGRPHVDVIHGSRVRKLKEARVDRGIRVLFAFDSTQNLVMLVGGDKTGKWKRWYPSKVQLAQRLYIDHERSIGKGGRCLTQREARRKSPQRSL